MKINSRTVNFFELQANTSSLDSRIPIPPQISLWKLIEIIAPFLKAGDEIKYGKTPIEVTQVKLDKAQKELVILLKDGLHNPSQSAS